MALRGQLALYQCDPLRLGTERLLKRDAGNDRSTPSNRQRPPILALIFDMDGLLVDSEPLAAAAMTAFLRRYGKEPRAEVGAQLLGRRLPEALAIVREAYELAVPVEELIAIYGEMRLAALRGNVRSMPGAAEVIAYGRSAGLRLALATSGQRAHADLSLGETGLAGLFDAEATGDEVERGKPAPDLFLLAAARVGVEPAACAVFEDAPLGVAAAVAAGMRAVAVPNAKSRDLPFPVAPEAVLPDLTAAIAWLRAQGVDGD
jgi:HAD superfamily hydrolase (TIGR01509 family)